jgi:hypothetical protein
VNVAMPHRRGGKFPIIATEGRIPIVEVAKGVFSRSRRAAGASLVGERPFGVMTDYRFLGERGPSRKERNFARTTFWASAPRPL